MGDDERTLGGGDRGRRQQQSGENEDRSSETRIRHRRERIAAALKEREVQGKEENRD